MLSLKTIRTLTLGLALAAPVAMAGDKAATSGCPAGTHQVGSKAEGLSCIKSNDPRGAQIAHGAYVEYHPNGQKAAEGQFADGLKVGTWTFYDATGKVRGTADFKDGGWHGKRVMYFPNGKPQLVEEYKSGRKHGVVTEMADDGRVVSQVQYDNNRVVSAQ
ncbi:hypothetical protein BHS06_22895 [Myxococcus xanthus]|uniref:toxin-antitoxin system YwqK family antitoxin n=1 Tax=Myxococcus xanthus TaxID=34 RepID=UPI001126D024|nr:hypothetical protein [Myxococcus xanthus]QDE91596.1 hypothetical protein BHS06_22895 [Myxococcus xanthus]